MKHKKEEVTVYADLNGWRVNGGTVPPDLALTEQIPDLVIIDKSTAPTKVVLLELTVPWDSSNAFQAAFDKKTERYERLADDLKRKGCTTHNISLEVGCRGVINFWNHGVLGNLAALVGLRGLQKLKGTLGRIALLGSYRIWLTRKTTEQ